MHLYSLVSENCFICPLYFMIVITDCLSMRDSEIFHFFVAEDVRKNTVIASGLALGNIYHDSVRGTPRIINHGDPGVASLSLVFEPTTESAVRNLQLIVSDRLDRESICPNPTTPLDSTSYPEPFMRYSASDFLVESDHSLGSMPGFRSEDTSKPITSQNKDCLIALKIASTDGHVQSISQIHVYLQDINDNPPVWSKQSITVYFKDGDPSGTKQSIPLATDADHGMNALISYRLQEVDYNHSIGPFGSSPNTARNTVPRVTDMFELIKESDTINHADSKLYLVAKHDIDREACPQGWDVLVIASNVGGGQVHSTQLSIHINVTDINDNAPKFSQSLYQPQLPNQKVGIIPETIGIGVSVLQLHATDIDEGLNAAITYEFAASPQTKLLRQFFRITKNGELQVKQRLQVDQVSRDQETHPSAILPTSPLTFNVIAVDGADPAYARTSTATVKLQIENVDDEDPLIRVHPIRQWRDANQTINNIWSNQTELAVSEDDPVGQLLALVEVHDPDRQGHDVVRCTVEGKSASMFRLAQKDSSRTEYRLYTAATLDREESPRVAIVIECRDFVDHLSTHGVGVNVLDVNDHAPRFDQSVYQFSVYEDDGELDPIVLRSSEPRWLSESGSVFVKATDLDDGQNKVVTYHISSITNDTGNRLFSVDEKTGELNVVGVLDREEVSKHQFIVLAIDGGTPKLTGSCTVNIVVLDLNDNAPIFASQQTISGGYAFTVAENQLPGKRVGQVEAYDLDHLPAAAYKMPHFDISQYTQNANAVDVNDRLLYGLKDEPDARHFWIDPKSGIMITRSVLDREKQAVYTFHATVRDGPLQAVEAKTPASSTRGRIHEVSVVITVTVDDENDNDPVFVRPNATNHMVLLDPAAIPGQSLLQLLAVDPDEGPNGLITYAIKGGNMGKLFNVDSRTGLVYLENPIPRKTIIEATAAAKAAPSAFAHRFGSGVHSGQTVDRIAEAEPYMPSHPTFLLALEACDQGERRRCSTFPNLQIQLRVLTDGAPHGGASAFADGSASEQDLLLGAESVSTDSFLGPSFLRSRNFGQLSVVEIIIITLSAFFSLIIIAVVATLCILRRRTRELKPNDQTKNPGSHKHAESTVELRKSSVSPRVGQNKSGKIVSPPPKENKWLTVNPAEGSEAGTLARDGIHFKSNPAMPDSLGYLGLNAHLPVCQYGTMDYGLMNASYQGNGYIGAEQYQSLEAWSAVDPRRFGFYVQNQSDLPCPYSPKAELVRLHESRTKSPGECAGSPNMSLSTTEPLNSNCFHEMKSSPIVSTVQTNNQTHLKAYSGFPRSSFV